MHGRGCCLCRCAAAHASGPAAMMPTPLGSPSNTNAILATDSMSIGHLRTGYPRRTQTVGPHISMASCACHSWTRGRSCRCRLTPTTALLAVEHERRLASAAKEREAPWCQLSSESARGERPPAPPHQSRKQGRPLNLCSANHERACVGLCVLRIRRGHASDD
jgi:hypothetical protein